MAFAEELHDKIEAQKKRQAKIFYLSIGLVTIVTPILYVVLGVMHLHSPNIKYESSDGGWSDSEIQLKGRNYKSIMAGFERYKEECGLAGVKLVRVTEFKKLNIFAWPNYIMHPKWELEYREPKQGATYSGMYTC